jgi:hypothetical protein
MPRVSAQITEKVFSAQIRQLAATLGWEVYCPWLAIHSPRGWPDLSLAKRLRNGTVQLVFGELKTEKGKVSDAQHKWLNLLNDVPGAIAEVWRPSDWDHIVLTLQGFT